MGAFEEHLAPRLGRTWLPRQMVVSFISRIISFILRSPFWRGMKLGVYGSHPRIVRAKFSLFKLESSKGWWRKKDLSCCIPPDRRSQHMAVDARGIGHSPSGPNPGPFKFPTLYKALAMSCKDSETRMQRNPRLSAINESYFKHSRDNSPYFRNRQS